MTHTIATVAYAATTHAWGISLPGLIAGAADEGALDASLRLAIADYTGWMRRHGDRTMDDDLAYEIVERVDGEALGSTGGEFLFAAERALLGEEELAMLLRRMAWAREDLLESIRDVPDAILDWAPPDSVIRHFDAWAPEARTIRGIAEHVLQLEIYYRSGLRDGPSAGIFERPGDAATERARTVELVQSLGADGWNRVFRPIRPGRTVAEAWNVRKMARRIISHERGHAAEIEQRRAWVLVGLPGDGQSS